MQIKGMTVLNQVVLFLLLFGVWIVLSGYLNPFFLSLGAFSCLASVYIGKQLSKSHGALVDVTIRLVKLPVYLVWLIKEIIVSSINVTKIVWNPALPINPGLAWIPTMQTDDIGITCFANSITLTPGTVSVVVEEGRICVHALQKEDLAELAQGDMDRRVAAWMGGSS